MPSAPTTPTSLLAAYVAAATPRERWRIEREIEQMGVAAMPALIAALDGPPEELQIFAAGALGRLGQRARQGAGSLVRLASSQSWRVRAAATWALVSISPRIGSELPSLVKRLEREEEPGARLALIVLLGRVGKRASGAIGALAAERVWIKEALLSQAQIAPCDPALHARLHACLQSDDEQVRATAVALLARVVPTAPQTTPALRAATLDRAARVRHAARYALERAGKGASRT